MRIDFPLLLYTAPSSTSVCPSLPVPTSNGLFLRLDLNGFKDVRCQKNSEEESSCGLTVFGVTFICSFVSLSVEGVP